jgi:hypothetical protein
MGTTRILRTLNRWAGSRRAVAILVLVVLLILFLLPFKA